MPRDLVEMTLALMREKQITYREARAELGRRGALVRSRNSRRKKVARNREERMGLL